MRGFDERPIHSYYIHCIYMNKKRRLHIKARIINVMGNGGKNENVNESSAIFFQYLRGGPSNNYSLTTIRS